MPRGPTANWNRHQYKKAAMLVYATAASAGSRGNVGKLCPAGHGESDQSAGTGTVFSGFHIFPGASFEIHDYGRPQYWQCAKHLPDRNSGRTTLMPVHFKPLIHAHLRSFPKDAPLKTERLGVEIPHAAP